MPSKSRKSAPKSNGPAAPLRNIKLVLEYDGSAFSGFQKQPDHPSVQEAVEKALTKLLGSKTKIGSASGRTDAGVHALRQVIHFKTTREYTPQEIRKAMNAILPPAIAVREAEEKPESFHARFDAKNKTYEYRIWNHMERSPFWRDKAWHVRRPLNLAKMREAAKVLTGEHDFRSFCTTDPARRENDTVRTIQSFKVLRKDGHLICIQITANGFLYRMVRNITGTLVEAGHGKISPETLKTVLKARDRREAGQTAPAHGLYLMNVTY